MISLNHLSKSTDLLLTAPLRTRHRLLHRHPREGRRARLPRCARYLLHARRRSDEPRPHQLQSHQRSRGRRSVQAVAGYDSGGPGRQAGCLIQACHWLTVKIDLVLPHISPGYSISTMYTSCIHVPARFEETWRIRTVTSHIIRDS